MIPGAIFQPIINNIQLDFQHEECILSVIFSTLFVMSNMWNFISHYKKLTYLIHRQKPSRNRITI